MFDYAPLDTTASALIERFGRTMTLRTLVQSGSAFDPTVTNSDASITGVMTGYRANQIDGTLIQAGDKLLLTHSAVTVQDKIVDDGKEYSVITVDTVKPGGTTLLYKVQVRA